MDSTNATTQKNRGPGATRARSSHEVGGRGGQDTRTKRDFDRHSGSDKTGVKAVEKRKGGGSHNWGDIQDDIEGQLEPFTVEKFDFGVLKDVGERKSFSVEEEPPKKTMDEYPKLQVEGEELETNVRNQEEDGDILQ